MLMLLCTTAWAAEVTLEYTGSTTGNMSGENDAALVGLDATAWSVVGEKGSASNMPGLNKDGDIRLYGNANGGNTLTVTSLSGATINSITITFTGANYSNAYVSVGGEDVTGSNGVYEIGNSAFVIGNANTNTTQVRIKKIVINYASDDPEAPTILLNGEAPASSYYVSDLPLSLTITSNNGTVTPYYHYSFADDPETVSSTIRAGATELTTGESSALNLQMGSNKLWVAEAIPNTETQQWSSSQWASATFTIKEDPTTVANIAALNQLSDGTEFSMTGDAVVAYVNGGYLYVKDESGYTLIYNSTVNDVVVGNTISNLKGVVSIYKNLFEVTSATYDVEATSVAVEPVVMTIPNITSSNMNQYVKIENVTVGAVSNKNFTMTDADGNELAGYTRFNGVTHPTDLTKNYDIEGFVSVFESTVQVYPISYTPVETPVEFAVTVTPEAGEYTEPVTVTITATDANAVIKYTLNGGDEITYTEPFTLNETTAVSVTATLGEEVATWTGTYTINIPVPVELDGKIVFKDNENDATANLDSDGIIAEMTKGADLVKNVSDISKVYAGATGLKFSSSSVNGSMTLNLKNKWNATKIAVIAKAWSGSSGLDAASISVNGNVFPLTGDFQKFEVPFTEATEIQAITVAATKRAYLKVVDIEGEEVGPSGPTYTITLDKQPGEYSTLINVKATVEPALPEGATLKYTIDDADPVAYDSEKGVSLLKSSVLKFTAYDAQNNALTDPVGGQYKYIVNVFGDMDGDGEVTVTDLNIVLNLILGKI